MRSACALCSAALQSPEQWERGLCDPCWSGRASARSATPSRLGWLCALAGVVALLLLGLQVRDLERELAATREALASARDTQAHQDAAVRAAEQAILRAGAPCSALADLHPALVVGLRVRGQR